MSTRKKLACPINISNFHKHNDLSELSSNYKVLKMFGYLLNTSVGEEIFTDLCIGKKKRCTLCNLHFDEKTESNFQQYAT